MNFRFEASLDFQLEAIEAVCGLFRGQESGHGEFTLVPHSPQNEAQLHLRGGGLSIGNQLTLPDELILENLHAIQRRNGLQLSDSLKSSDFTVEMETGTGKTYVYLRTIFELNRRYGFTKFVVVVPSVAIKEGVHKALQMTRDHFLGLYSGTPFEHFLYDSRNLGQVRNFATSSRIQLMIVTVGAINKQDVNNLYKQSEKTGGLTPIELIRSTIPIVIVDEPQSVDGGLQGRGRRALASMNPLCTLRYSATHVHEHHMVYRLDAIDAYERKLVKQIEVASAMVEDAHNRPYVQVVSVSNSDGVISAKVRMDIEAAGTVRRQLRVVEDGDNLEYISGRSVYRDCWIGEIRAEKGNEFVEVREPRAQRFLKLGQATDDVSRLGLQRQMIRRTIREHLDKERRFHSQGIKVLSLFFIDAVNRYRKYDAVGNPIKGVYARIFEEEYQRIARHPDYRDWFGDVDPGDAAARAHAGYFSIDRKKIAGTTVEVFKDTRGKGKVDEDTYSLIMRDKERLLSLETPLKFIFSHSALREGWDNPNVFQICTLRDILTEQERRQTIGRGLRLCVDQAGERIRDVNINTLTVIATESYEEFAENLQHEIETDTGIRFGILEPHHFAVLPISEQDGGTTVLGQKSAQILWDYLKDEGFIDAEGRIQEPLRKALTDDTLVLPKRFSAHRELVIQVLLKRAGRLEIKNADERQVVRPRQAVLHSPDFKSLWDRIKHKTTYRLDFDNEKLLTQCVQSLQKAPMVPKPRLQWRKAGIAMSQAGLETSEISTTAPISLDDGVVELPDVLTELQHRTDLTRRSIQRILCQSERLQDFGRNPQRFIEFATHAINRCKRSALVDGIKYQRLGDEFYYAQTLFQEKELTGYLKNMIRSHKSVYEQVVYESQTESKFASELEANSAVKVYAKLPGWFKVPTPLGSYNPDWAVLVDSDEGERLYLVVETKGSVYLSDLRQTEESKIACGRAHFSALKAAESSARYQVATSVDELLAAVAID